MPIYEFNCNDCGATVSIFVRTVNSPVGAVCQSCGGTDLRRLISSFSVHHSLAGSGNLDSVDAEAPQAVAAWSRKLHADAGGGMASEFAYGGDEHDGNQD